VPAPPIDFAMLLNQSSYALAARLNAALADCGVTVRMYCVLDKAAQGEFTQGQIAEAAWLDKTTMVVTVDELERRGLAERRPSPTDRRARVIAVTPEGRRALERAHGVVQGVYDEVLAGVPKTQREAFSTVLTRLVDGPLAAPFHLEDQRPARRRRQPAER
jgi:MarR family transcriptional regulator, transcriptional regulator for hemolysin